MMKELKLDYYFEDMGSCPIKEAFDGIEYPWQALDNKKNFSDTEIKGEIDKTVVIKGNIKVGEGTIINPYVVIEGPVIIGKNCFIRSFALLRPGTVLGDNVIVGHATEVKNVIAFNEVKIASHVFIGDSILGKGARIGSGTIIGNRRFDQKNAKIKINGKMFDTGKDKYGGIFGDYSRLGANSLTSPGVMVGKYTWIYGGVSLSGIVEKEKLVKIRSNLELVDKEKDILSISDKEGNI